MSGIRTVPRPGGGILVFLLAFLPLASVAMDRESDLLERLRAGQPLRVGVYNFAPLLSIREGKGEGLYIELIEKIAHEEGWKIEYVPGSWSDCLERLNSGKLDVLPGIVWTAERGGSFVFTDAALVVEWGLLFTRPGKELLSLQDLARKKIAALGGSFYLDYFRSMVAQLGTPVELSIFSEYDRAFGALAAGEADAVICTNLLGLAYEHRYQVIRSTIVFAPVKIEFAGRRGGGEDFIAFLSNRLRQFKASQAFQDRYAYWLDLTEGKPLPVWVPYVLGGIILLALGLVIFVLALRSAVQRRTAELVVANQELRKSESRYHHLSEELEIKIAERTAELGAANEEYAEANRNLSETNARLEGLLDELKNTQDELIAREKLAVLGRLTAGIAHELNSPLGAIASAASHCESVIGERFLGILSFMRGASDEEARFIASALMRAEGSEALPSASRAERKAFAETLKKVGLPEAEYQAARLVDSGWDIQRPLPAFIAGKRGGSLVDATIEISGLAVDCHLVVEAAEQARKVVDALRRYSRGDAQSRPVPLDVTEGMDAVLLLYRHLFKRGVEVERRYEAVPPVLGDATRLNQVWVNLVMNAAQAMDYRGRLSVGIAPDKGQVLVIVEDEGKGIPPELADKLFIPFFTTKPAGEGTGLGLSIAKDIVEEHGGIIDFESRPGRTVFRVRLPPAAEGIRP